MPRPITPDTFVYGFTPAGDPQVAPDGTRILYALTRMDRQTKKASTQLWMCGIDGSDPRQLSWSGERNGGARWSPDGTQIAFISDRASGLTSNTSRRGKQSGIFLLPANGVGEARALTSHHQPISDIAWSPDGTRIAYTTLVDPANADEKEPPEGATPKVRVTRRLDYKQDNRGYLGDTRSQVFVVDVASGQRRQLTHEPVDHWVPQWSPDGRTLAVQVRTPNNWYTQLGLIDVASGQNGKSGKSGKVRRFGTESGVVGAWAWSPDGGTILFAGDTKQTYQLDFFLLDVARGTVKRLTDDLHCLPDTGVATIAPPAQPVWLDERRALFHAFEHGASGLYTIDTQTGAVERIVRWEALNQGLSADARHRYCAQSHSSFERVGEIGVYDRQTGKTRIVTTYSAPILADAPPASWERFEVQRGKYTIEAWLLKPANFDPSKHYPLVLDVHGGPNGHYGHIFNATQQILATNGFLVVLANPRGSSSYGREFTQQVIRDWGGEDYLDLMAVVNAVLERPYADAERTGIFGYSYGGYMTAWTIGQTQRFKAAVCGAPCFDLESMFGTSDIGHAFGVEQWGVPHEDPSWFEKHSPSTYAHRARTPTLIMHGEADDRCPIGQGEQMFVALARAGCEVEFVRYPGGSHLFLRGGPAEHREDFYARVLSWFQTHLGAAREPSGTDAKRAPARAKEPVGATTARSRKRTTGK
jgi:dipeptidyl aminopeptidase/acylaminoacyl peptidase